MYLDRLAPGGIGVGILWPKEQRESGEASGRTTARAKCGWENWAWGVGSRLTGRRGETPAKKLGWRMAAPREKLELWRWQWGAGAGEALYGDTTWGRRHWWLRTRRNTLQTNSSTKKCFCTHHVPGVPQGIQQKSYFPSVYRQSRGIFPQSPPVMIKDRWWWLRCF